MAALYLIDGSFELFRCYYGAPKAQLDSGAEVAAVRALFRTLAALLREPELTHAAIAFDDVQLLVAREASDTVLIQSQYDAALETARALGVTLWQMSEYQADDAIATAAHRFRSDPVLDEIVICSSDNDFAQCVRGERVVLLNRIKRERTDEAGVVAKFGVGPGFIPEYLGLVGDPSDGIPGIAGFGRKSAAAAISRFGRLEDFPEDPAEWESLEVRGRQKLAETFAARRAEALDYRDRSIKSIDVPLSESLEDLRWRGADRGKVHELAEALADPALRERPPMFRNRE